DTGITKYIAYLEEAHPAIAKKHVKIQGVNVLDQILQNALNHIYAGQYVEAITECKRALKLDPHSVLAMKRLGSAYFALGNKKEAYDIWQEALDIDPRDEELREFLKNK
ncbi:MAG: tetratricopeptide repeat protein, partial [Elusimicrobia bacterium]|nr:tetratricopeptide repeat protein [Elusimicrobiota bacterium]MBD3412686.1 tetratricopeptide repeat protein [Elusimicrobiota bacterium]